MTESQGYKKKKPTKAEAMASISNHFEDKLKDGYILNMMQGFEIANQMLLDYINSGHTVDEVKSFIEKNLSPNGKEARSKVVRGEK